MAQSSGPISQGTTAERQFTDVQWRDLFGDEPGVIDDLDGSAYKLDLSGGADVVSVGSTTQASIARVAGFAHRIPQSSPEPITIPVASGSTRTDVIALRYDPAYTGLPGPVRLVRIAGTTSAVPTYDSSPPGVEELPLWSITRSVGQALAAATVVRMFPRLAPALDLPAGSTLPTSSPLGTLVRVGKAKWRREMVSGSAAWISDDIPVLANIAARDAYFSGQLTGGLCALVNSELHVYNGAKWCFRTAGRATLNLNGSGLDYITHGMGVVPSPGITLTPVFQIDEISEVFKPTIGAVSSTTIQVVGFRTDSSARLTGTEVIVDWSAES